MSNDASADLSIRAVTHENWRAALRLAVHPEQQRFVADSAPIAAIALAKAYIRPMGLLWSPYAFYAGAEMIGFTELAHEPGSTDNYWIFHFFIDRGCQRRGYGKQALPLFINYIRLQHAGCVSVCLTVHPENLAALRLYAGAGFQPTGDVMDGEPVYRLSL